MRKEPLLENEYYHIYNRGVDKRIIFNNPHDLKRFTHALYILNNFLDIPQRFNIYDLEPKKLLTPIQPYVEIVAACLMPNHYHLMVMPKQKDGLSKFLHKIGTSYTKYFNIRYKRSGRLFENTFKAKHVDRGEYASYLTQYIHLNPVKLYQAKLGTINTADNIIDQVKSYTWSTLPEYLGNHGNLSLLLTNTSFRDTILGLDANQYRNHLHELYKELYQA